MDKLYLYLNICTIAGPLLLSFDKKVAFYKKWKALFPAILLTAAVFIGWDAAFTHMGVWGFNPDYLIGIEMLGLPLEEWLFFITIPYACVFIYECYAAYSKRNLLEGLEMPICWILGVSFICLAIMFRDQWYTAMACGYTGLWLMLQAMVFNGKYLGNFFMSYLIVLIPFFLINGILTGTGIEDQVVWYNDAENWGLRLLSIPLEDSIYNLGMLLMCVTVYEGFKSR